MEGKARCSSTSPVSTPCRSAWTAPTIDEIVETVVRLAPGFGGINLEDISAPRCFEIEQQLQERLDIPVFHDDQHGTAIVVLAALENAAKLTGRTPRRPARRREWRRRGRHRGDPHPARGRHRRHRGGRQQRPRARQPHRPDPGQDRAGRRHQQGRAAPGRSRSALVGADVFLGLSAGKVAEDAVATMADELRSIFAMANPDPEVDPAMAGQVRAGGGHRPQRLPEPDQQRAGVPGRLPRRVRGAGARVTEGMKLAAATALAAVVGDDLVRGLRDPERLRRPGGPGGRSCGRRGSARGRRRPPLTLPFAGACARPSQARPQTGQREGRSVMGNKAPQPALLHRTTSCVVSH